ncbi:MAG: 1-acyl-sn-glycerol-3-phosphate acyltransferase [Porticoccaceae bacterium]|jgi:1-acyl-sn-glycerol-3-phosphate acyltransferase|nr:1-acyl-sn-glycerol-3-phosphate acyltransferase [Porticoccaceae bacterium]
MSKKILPVSEEQCPAHLRTNRSALTRWFGRTAYRAMGWKLEGKILDSERVLITAAPHTSNWDFVMGICAVLGINARVRWLGKHSIFKFGVTWFMRWLGGIPVNREKPDAVMGYVDAAVEKDNGVVIVVAPEGTRKKSTKWKTGFLRIAEKNDCKIQLGALDFPNKRIVLSDEFKPTGDHQADIATIIDYYRQFKGKYPDQF